ncbi:hypothetical protein KA037_03370 [Patescibacteria group bacterium]|nr:hypothetical protein [Patescibacteria group bacterium]
MYAHNVPLGSGIGSFGLELFVDHIGVELLLDQLLLDKDPGTPDPPPLLPPLLHPLLFPPLLEMVPIT